MPFAQQKLFGSKHFRDIENCDKLGLDSSSNFPKPSKSELQTPKFQLGFLKLKIQKIVSNQVRKVDAYRFAY